MASLWRFVTTYWPWLMSAAMFLWRVYKQQAARRRRGVLLSRDGDPVA